MSRRRQCPCPTPSKRSYLDEEEAATDAQRIAARIERGPKGFVPLYVYQCACRRFHLTHHSMSPDSRFQKRVA